MIFKWCTETRFIKYESLREEGQHLTTTNVIREVRIRFNKRYNISFLMNSKISGSSRNYARRSANREFNESYSYNEDTRRFRHP